MLKMLWIVWTAWMVVVSGSKFEVSESITTANRLCTAEELLPQALLHNPPMSLSASSEWSDDIVKTAYGCECSFYRARCGSVRLHPRSLFDVQI